VRPPKPSSPESEGFVTEAIQLLVVQPTPFCNIQCDYCYLPDRESTARLAPATFGKILSAVFASGLVNPPLSVVWHAGEPLVLPADYYVRLFGAIDELGIARAGLRHSMQTNATLLNEAWCDFICAQDIHIGVSIDGPAFLNDRHRKDRQGRGTHERTMKGIRLLRERNIDFHVIAVVTSDSLDYAGQIFDFFLQLGVRRIGFNVEELEGENLKSSLIGQAKESRIRKFWERLYERQQQSGGAVAIREFDRAYAAIVHGPSFRTAEEAVRKSSQVAPLGIISVDWQGNLSSFSPELLGLKSLHYGDFAFGAVGETALLDLLRTPKMKRVASDIYQGVKRCEESCEYFCLCGGGAPSNKYFENGTFVSAQTMFCRASIQMPADIVLKDLENRLDLAVTTATT